MVESEFDNKEQIYISDILLLKNHPFITEISFQEKTMLMLRQR